MLFQLYDASTVKNFNEFEDYATIKESLIGSPWLYEDVRFVRNETASTVWRRPKDICKKPYFIKGKPSRFDVLQGKEGDCWAIAAFQVLASNIDLFKCVVPRQGFGEEYTGAFHFRFFKLGTWYDVVVDDRLPINIFTSRLEKAHSKNYDIFWGALVEKAFAKFCSDQPYGYRYVSLDGGRMMTSLQAVTGGIVECQRLTGPKYHYRWQSFLWICQADQSLIVATTEDGKKGLLPGHAYPFIMLYIIEDTRSMYNRVRLVKLMNPWGFQEWQGEWSDDDYKRWFEIDVKMRRHMGYNPNTDGSFWMSEDDFFTYFDSICVCHLNPTYFVRRLGFFCSRSNWYVTFLRGEWVKNITAGGGLKYRRHKNPQYVFTIGRDRQKKVDECPTVFELTIWSKTSRMDTMQIGLYFYDLSSDDNEPPFTQSFFLKHEPVHQINFNDSYSRCFVDFLEAELGRRYLVVPCTMKQNFEALYTLRVSSHYYVTVSDASVPKISKSLPKETDSTNEVDEELVDVFFKASRGKDEIDWIGLREILNDVLGKSTDSISFFISYLFKFVANVFLPNTSYDDRDGELLFSKDECRKMIAMLDHDHSGTLNFSEFTNLWNKIGFWTKVYDEYKEEEHGCLPTGELRDALSAIGHDVSTHIVHSFSYLYADDQSHISLKDFILCGVALETVLTLCMKKKREDENIVFTLQEWVKHTLIL